MTETIPTHKEIQVPQKISDKWQKLLDLTAKLSDVPVALIMQVKPPYIEVFATSKTIDNPYKKGDSEKLPGLYCETVIRTDQILEVDNAIQSEKWKNNPDIGLGMIAYLGTPLKWPDGKFFGTICILDKKENKFDKNIKELISTCQELIEFQLELIYKCHTLKN